MNRQKGFTLLEVLIAVVVFSVGLLGLAGLQIMSLKLSHDSLLRSQATLLAKDMADRIRSNIMQAELGAASPYNNPTGLGVGSPACISKDATGNYIDTSCTSQAMALHDFYEWSTQISGSTATAWHPAIKSKLPTGIGIVCIDSSPDDGLPPPGDPACDNTPPTAGKNIYTIKIWWDERKDVTNPNPHRFVMSVSI